MVGRTKGFHHTAETKHKISLSMKGKPTWNKGLHTGMVPSTAFKKGNHPKTEFKKGIVYLKRLQWRRPTGLEQKMINIIEKLNLPYKYVGDGNFFIENKNPDFINVNGEKIAFEVYAEIFKLRSFHDIDKWKKERQETFAKYGWTIEFFNEKEVTEEGVRIRNL